jgi:hypothetical protein
MPAYGSALSPQQTTALVGFLGTLNGNQMPARNLSRALAQGDKLTQSRHDGKE